MATRTLHFEKPRLLHQLYCGNEENLRVVEKRLVVDIVTRDNWIEIEGDEPALDKVESLFELLGKGRTQGLAIKDADFLKMLNAVVDGKTNEVLALFENKIVVKIKNKSIVPKNINQKRYLESILKNDVVFGVGPAGTGKTYLAIALGLKALLEGDVERLMLTRPAVEAGETLGFLPGDLEEKILPYLRPLYDAMEDMLGREGVQKLIEKGQIEIAPLAYMRGRTLSNAFVILDEAQNTTPEQMIMFLTRLGEGAQMVVTGDITQIDLPKSKLSGLKQASEVLNDIKGVDVFYFNEGDVVRHPLVMRIIKAYSALKE